MKTTGLILTLPVLLITSCSGGVATSLPATASQNLATPTATAATAARFKLPCGTVTAYAAPTASAPGTVSLGTSTFVLLPGSGPINTSGVSGSLCVSGEQDGAGAFTQFSISPMGAGVCGVVAAYIPASATAAGILDFATKPPLTVPVAAGVTFSQAQITGDHCFRVVPDAQGTAHITAYLSPRT